MSATLGPLTALGELVSTFLYPTPSAGFGARVGVLLALCAYAIIVSTVNLILLLRNSRRQHKTPWLVRLVSRADGAFILLNQTLWWPICVFVNSALQVAYLAESYETYTQKEDLADSYFWRTLICLPILIHGTIATFSILQASVLTQEHGKAGRVLRPWIANAAFLSVLVLVVLVPNITLGVLAAYKFRGLIHSGLELQQEVAQASASGTITTIDFADILSAANGIQTQRLVVAKFALGLYCVYIITIAIVVVVNLTGLSLLARIKRQIRFNASLAGHPTGSGRGVNDVVVSMNSDTRVEAGAAEHAPPAGEKRHALSMDAAAASGQHDPHSRQLAALQKVQSDLSAFVFTICLVAAVYLAMCIWVATQWRVLATSWYWTELPLLIPVWIYQPTVCISTTVLVVNMVRHLRSPHHGAPRTPRISTTGGVTPQVLSHASDGAHGPYENVDGHDASKSSQLATSE